MLRRLLQNQITDFDVSTNYMLIFFLVVYACGMKLFSWLDFIQLVSFLLWFSTIIFQPTNSLEKIIPNAQIG